MGDEGDMVDYTNPAGRLHALLDEAKKVKQAQKTKLRDGWAQVLGVEEPRENRTLLLHRLGKVLALPAQIRREIGQVEGIDHQQYLGRMNEIESALGMMNLDGTNWKQFTDKISDAAMDRLAFCSHELSRGRHIPDTSEETLADVRTKVAELRGQVSQMSLDAELKAYLVRALDELLNALDEYVIVGVQGVEETVDRAVGHIMRRPRLRNFLNEDIVKTVLAVMTTVYMTLAATNQALELTARAQADGPDAPVIVEIADTEPDPLPAQRHVPADPQNSEGEHPHG